MVTGALPTARFRSLAFRVRRLGAERMRSTYRTTFWFDLGEPTGVAEESARILRAHLPQEGIAGVEWWLSRMWTNDVRIDFHRDRDERLALRTGRVRHPRFSSVLFLNRVRGGSLAVTAARPCAANPAFAPLPLDADLVAPRANRFVWFDGALTHGVLDRENRIPARRLAGLRERRLTLVMNWWSRRPEGVRSFAISTAYRGLVRVSRAANDGSTTAAPQSLRDGGSA